MSNNVKSEKRNCLRKLMILWGMLVIGHVVGLLLYCGFPTTFTCTDMRLVAFLPISAIVFAAIIGPLTIVVFFLTLFRVQGGTATAILSIACGTSLLCWGLFRLAHKFLKAEGRPAQWLLGIVLMGYSALSTFALLYGGSSI